MKKNRRRLLLVLDVVLVIALIAGIAVFQRRPDSPERSLVRSSGPSLVHDGTEYPLKPGLRSVLLIGTDSAPEGGRERAELLAVLVFDERGKTLTPLLISPDAVSPAAEGGREDAEDARLAQVYALGSDKKASCADTREAMEKLLYGAPIDSYLALDMAAIPLVTNLAGGVTVELEEDLSALDPTYRTGERVTLTGEAALAFVRYRADAPFSDGYGRLARHRLYLEAWLGKMAQRQRGLSLFDSQVRDAIAKDPVLSKEGVKAAANYVTTDLSAGELTGLLDKLCTYSLQPTRCPAGEYTQSGAYLLSDNSLWESVRDSYCP